MLRLYDVDFVSFQKAFNTAGKLINDRGFPFLNLCKINFYVFSSDPHLFRMLRILIAVACIDKRF